MGTLERPFADHLQLEQGQKQKDQWECCYSNWIVGQIKTVTMQTPEIWQNEENLGGKICS